MLKSYLNIIDSCMQTDYIDPNTISHIQRHFVSIRLKKFTKELAGECLAFDSPKWSFAGQRSSQSVHKKTQIRTNEKVIFLRIFFYSTTYPICAGVLEIKILKDWIRKEQEQANFCSLVQLVVKESKRERDGECVEGFSELRILTAHSPSI